MKDQIRIIDWAGNVLFEGNYKSKEVDHVLKVNACKCKFNDSLNDYCKACDCTGYKGDFEVFWLDSNDERNVYEFINY